MPKSHADQPGQNSLALGSTAPHRRADKLVVETERFEDAAPADSSVYYRYAGQFYHFTLAGRRATARVYDNESETACIIGFDKKHSLRFRLKKIYAPTALPYGDPLLAAIATHLLNQTPVRQISVLTRGGYVPLDFARAVGTAAKGSSGQG
jgi:hypothetical protein